MLIFNVMSLSMTKMKHLSLNAMFLAGFSCFQDNHLVRIDSLHNFSILFLLLLKSRNYNPLMRNNSNIYFYRFKFIPYICVSIHMHNIHFFLKEIISDLYYQVILLFLWFEITYETQIYLRFFAKISSCLAYKFV